MMAQRHAQDDTFSYQALAMLIQDRLLRFSKTISIHEQSYPRARRAKRACSSPSSILKDA